MNKDRMAKGRLERGWRRRDHDCSWIVEEKLALVRMTAGKI